MDVMDVLEQQLMFLDGSLLCAGIGSVTDVSECRIPNWVIGPAIVAGLKPHATCCGWRGLKSHPELTLSNTRTLRLPFALPIAAGCLITLCTLAWEARP
jgi:Flp pilus assembly protein protease CpaA